MNRRSFTMIELVFIIVILGLLAAVAIPKLAASREDSKIISISQDIETIMQAIPAMAMSRGEAAVTKFSDAVVLNKTNWGVEKPVRHGSLNDATEIYAMYSGYASQPPTSGLGSCLIISFEVAPDPSDVEGIAANQRYLKFEVGGGGGCEELGVPRSGLNIPLTGKSIKF